VQIGHGALGDAEPLGNLAVAHALPDEVDQLPLTRRQRPVGAAFASPGKLGGALGQFDRTRFGLANIVRQSRR
jgi:hypothetical protein